MSAATLGDGLAVATGRPRFPAHGIGNLRARPAACPSARTRNLRARPPDHPATGTLDRREAEPFGVAIACAQVRTASRPRPAFRTIRTPTPRGRATAHSASGTVAPAGVILRRRSDEPSARPRHRALRKRNHRARRSASRGVRTRTLRAAAPPRIPQAEPSRPQVGIPRGPDTNPPCGRATAHPRKRNRRALADQNPEGSGHEPSERMRCGSR
jgi:hypothetical protein